MRTLRDVRDQYLSEWFSSEQVLAAGLARHQRLDRRPLDAGHRASSCTTTPPSRRAGGIRQGVRRGRDRAPDRGDGRGGARGGRESAPRRQSTIVVEGGRATGVLLADGEERRGACCRTPIRRRPCSVWSTRGSCRSASRRRSRLPLRGTSVKINLAVDQLPVAAAIDGASSRTTGVSPRSIRRSRGRGPGRGAGGIPATDPHIELCVPTVHDPSLAPAGKHVVTIDVNSQPYTLADGSWDGIRDEVADRAIAKLGEHFPNLPGSILERQVLRRPTWSGCWGSGAATRFTARWPSTSSSTCGRCAAGASTARRSATSGSAGPAPTGGGVTGPTGATAREVLREARGLRADRGAGMSPSIPRPGMRSRRPASRSSRPARAAAQILDRIERSAYRAPAVAERRWRWRKLAWTVTDADGNVYLDCASASASVPLGAGRGAARAGDRRASEVRNEDSHALASELMAELGERLLAAAPGSLTRYDIRPERDRGGRDRGQDDAPRDRPAGHPRLPRRLPRRVDHDGAWRRGRRDLERAARPGTRLRPRALPIPTERRFAIRGPAGAATRPSTTSPTTCCSTRSTPPTSGGCRHRAGAGLGRVRAARLVLARAHRPLPPSTTGCSARTRSRPAWGARGSSSRWSAGASNRT